MSPPPREAHGKREGEMEAHGKREVMLGAVTSKYSWFYTYHATRLHFVPEAGEGYAFWERAVIGSEESSYARAACGVKAEWSAPGIFSRMGMPRCKRCCKAAGIEPGEGTPFNDKEQALGVVG